MKERRTPNYISLDQANVAVAMFDRQRTFINCLPSIDLEMRFQGTIFWEMDDLDRTNARSFVCFRNMGRAGVIIRILNGIWRFEMRQNILFL